MIKLGNMSLVFIDAWGGVISVILGFLSRESAGFCAVMWAWTTASLGGFLETAFFCHMVRFSAIEAEFLLETSVFFFFVKTPWRGRWRVAREQINLGSLRVFLTRGNTAGISPTRFLPRKARGLVQAPDTIELTRLFDKGIQGRRLRRDTEDLGVQGHGESAAEGIHFSIIVDAGTRSIGGPFLVPIIEGAIPHS